MWVTLERNPKTDEWVPVGTTHILGRMKRFWCVTVPDTVWPVLIAGLLVSVGVVSAVMGYSGDPKVRAASVGSNIVDSLIADPSIFALPPEPNPPAPITAKNIVGKVSDNASASASLWLTNSPPVSDYRSVSAGNWLSQ